VALPHLGRMPFGSEASGVRGVFIHKNVLGWYAGLCLVALVGLYADGTYLSRRLVVVAMAVAGLCLMLSTSVTALLAATAALTLIPFYAALRRHHGVGRAMLVVAFLQALVFLGIGLSELLVPTMEWLGKDATLTGRVPLWHLVDEEIGRNLFLGYGYQAFWTEASPEAWRVWARVGWMAPHAHSGFRDVLLNFGLFGFLVLVATVARALRQGAALFCARPEEGWLWLNLVIVWLLVLNLAESVMLIQNDFLFVLFATAILSVGLRAPDLAAPPPGSSFRRGALPYPDPIG
jgi:exopolysaccharide production protein ExoQ